jgi:hypothetical protein
VPEAHAEHVAELAVDEHLVAEDPLDPEADGLVELDVADVGSEGVEIDLAEAEGA